MLTKVYCIHYTQSCTVPTVSALFAQPLNFSQMNIFKGYSEKNKNLMLQDFLEEADFLDLFQSGFRPGFETKTALVALVDDLCQELGRGM